MNAFVICVICDTGESLITVFKFAFERPFSGMRANMYLDSDMVWSKNILDFISYDYRG